MVVQAASRFMTMEEHKRNHKSNGKIIVSYYVDGMTPPKEELLQIVALMQATGADIIKLVTHAADITEITRIFSLLPYCQAWIFFFIFHFQIGCLLIFSNVKSN